METIKELFDKIEKPLHYHKGDIDVIEFIERYFPDRKFTVAEGFAIGNALKYICRYKEKNGLEDLQKAEGYLKRLQGYEADS
ncbi:DUF3310 domain-containing protein [Bacillus marasmi]|uniref:DUF3310 domain-containing protein n=1 Tax=Bacillus marasmi TaxID=1926279 RepID=UPI0011CA1049|nr:DUF3310 domain-containing protein [Bacillus marasmi]